MEPFSFGARASAEINKRKGFQMHIREVRLSAGAGFVIPIAGEIMTMPGLPRKPAAERSDMTSDGVIVGLS